MSNSKSLDADSWSEVLTVMPLIQIYCAVAFLQSADQFVTLTALLHRSLQDFTLNKRSPHPLSRPLELINFARQP